MFACKQGICKNVNKRKQSLFLTCFHFKKTFLKSKLVGNFKNYDFSHLNLQYFLLFTCKQEIQSKVNKRKESLFLASLKNFMVKTYWNVKSFDPSHQKVCYLLLFTFKQKISKNVNKRKQVHIWVNYGLRNNI